MTPMLFTPRKGHTTHAVPGAGNILATFGGLIRQKSHSENGEGVKWTPTAEVLLLDLTASRWTRLQTYGAYPKPRCYHVAEILAGTTQLIVFGGRTTPPSTENSSAISDNGVLNDLYTLDFETGIWRKICNTTGDLPPPRMCSASVFANGIFLIFSGGSCELDQDCLEFCPETRHWRRFHLANEPACSRPTVVYVGDRLLFYGGCDNTNHVMGSSLLELPLPPLSLCTSSRLWLFQNHTLRGALHRIHQNPSMIMGRHHRQGRAEVSTRFIADMLSLQDRSRPGVTSSLSNISMTSNSVRVMSTNERAVSRRDNNQNIYTNSSLSFMNPPLSNNFRNVGGNGGERYESIQNLPPYLGEFSPAQVYQYSYLEYPIHSHYYCPYFREHRLLNHQHSLPVSRSTRQSELSRLLAFLMERRESPYLLRGLAIFSQCNY
ncbi:unnamed protein product [Phytomonas sp. Hart1]|nr:unnamed protein product [Phytomonas sp. Hart1]|eukprot:CCW66075.1 unnamed protein product [Phytomonas sp. isolate Hart1]